MTLNNAKKGASVLGSIAGVGVISNAVSQRPDFVDFLNDGSLMFPSDLEAMKYYVTFKFEKYQRRSIFDTFTTAPLGGIRLPFPGNGSMRDTQSVSYDQVSNKNKPMVSAAIEAYLSSGKSPAVSEAQAAGAAVAVATARDQANSLLGPNSFEQAIQLAGLAQNPFLTVLFNSPTFKRHRFTWRLAPVTEAETNTLKNIITKIRYHSLPDLAPGSAGSLLTYPDMCQIQFSPSDSYLYSFKPCVVETIAVDYAPNNNPSMFKRTNAPTEVIMMIDFLEIEYWLKKDIVGAI